MSVPAGGADPPVEVRFLGHSTVLVEMGCYRVLTDPVLRPTVTVALRRVAAPVPAAAYAGCDLVVISHIHHDHLDLPSLALLGAGTRFIVPVGAGRLLGRCGFTEVDELAVGSTLDLGSLHVTAVEAVHSGWRMPFGPRAEAVGYLFNLAGRRIYFAGDTGLFPAMTALGDDGLDLALLPVWGWGPTLGPGHLDPQDAAEAAARLRPLRAVPVHWGTLWPRFHRGRGRARLVDPPHEFATAAAERGLPVSVEVLAPGERTVLG